MKLAGLSPSVRAPSDYGGNAYCLQCYGMVGTGHAYNSMVQWVWLPKILWYACLQFYDMVGNACL